MLNNQKIKKLAQMVTNNLKVSPDVEELVLKYFEKKDLKEFLNQLKIARDKKRIYIYSQTLLSADNLKLIKASYPDKEIVTQIDESFGAGAKIKNNDMVVDFTFKNYINETIASLKN